MSLAAALVTVAIGKALGVLLLDISNFKQINDAYTRAAGDQVLQSFATRLSRVIRGSDLFFYRVIDSGITASIHQPLSTIH